MDIEELIKKVPKSEIPANHPAKIMEELHKNCKITRLDKVKGKTVEEVLFETLGI